jgi:rubrerythrin
LTVQQDLEKAKAAAQSALGTYSSFAASTQDQTAKQMFEDLASDAERHVAMLNGRLNYLVQNNDLNQQQTT